MLPSPSGEPPGYLGWARAARRPPPAVFELCVTAPAGVLCVLLWARWSDHQSRPASVECNWPVCSPVERRRPYHTYGAETSRRADAGSEWRAVGGGVRIKSQAEL